MYTCVLPRPAMAGATRRRPGPRAGAGSVTALAALAISPAMPAAASATKTIPEVLTWGSNVDGQLGNGTTTGSRLPVRVHLPGGFTPTSIGAGWDSRTAIVSGRQLPD